MAKPNQTTQLDVTNKMSLSVGSTTNDKNYFEEEFPWRPQLDFKDVFGEEIPFAADPASADANVIANPTMLVKLTDHALDEIPLSNGQGYSMYKTPGDTSSSRLTDFVLPQKYGPGYVFVLKDSGGTTIPLTAGAYQFDYANGILRFDNAHTPATMGWSLPLQMTAYRYVGDKVGGGSGGGCSILVVDGITTTNASSTSQIPNGSFIEKIKVNIGTPYNAGASITVVIDGTTYFDSADYDITTLGTVIEEIDTSQISADSNIDVVVTGATAGASSVSVTFGSDTCSGGGVSGSGFAAPENIVYVDSTQPEEAGQRYQTWAAADVYVQTQTPSATNRWGIAITGPNSENITLRSYVAILGMNTGRLQGSVTSGVSWVGDMYEAAIVDMSLDNFIMNNATSQAVLINCSVNGGTVSAGVFLMVMRSYIFGGTFSGVFSLMFYDDFIMGGDYTNPDIHYSVISDANVAPITIHGLNAFHCLLQNGTVNYDPTSNYFIMDSYCDFDIDTTGVIHVQNSVVDNTWTYSTGGQIYLHNTVMGNAGSFIDNGGTFQVIGAVYDNRASGLTAGDVQSAIDELVVGNSKNAAWNIRQNVIIVNSAITADIAGYAYTTYAAAIAYVNGQSPTEINRYTIEIHNDTGDAIDVPTWVSVVGVGKRQIELSGAVTSGSGAVDVLEREDAVLKNVKISSLNVAAGRYLKIIDSYVSGGTTLGQVEFLRSNVYGLTATAGGAKLIFRNSTINPIQSNSDLEVYDSIVTDNMDFTNMFPMILNGGTFYRSEIQWTNDALHTYNDGTYTFYDCKVGLGIDNGKTVALNVYGGEFNSAIDAFGDSIHLTTKFFNTVIKGDMQLAPDSDTTIINSVVRSTIDLRGNIVTRGIVLDNGVLNKIPGAYTWSEDKGITYDASYYDIPDDTVDSVKALDKRFYTHTSVTINPSYPSDEPWNGIFRNLNTFFAYISDKRLLDKTTVTLLDGSHDVSDLTIDHLDSRLITIISQNFMNVTTTSNPTISYVGDLYTIVANVPDASLFAVDDRIAIPGMWGLAWLIAVGVWKITAVNTGSNQITMQANRYVEIPRSGSLGTNVRIIKNSSIIKITSGYINVLSDIKFSNVNIESDADQFMVRVGIYDDNDARKTFGIFRLGGNVLIYADVYKGNVEQGIHVDYGGSVITDSDSNISGERFGTYLYNFDMGISATDAEKIDTENVHVQGCDTSLLLDRCRSISLNHSYVTGNDSSIFIRASVLYYPSSMYIQNNHTDGINFSQVKARGIFDVKYNSGDGISVGNSSIINNGNVESNGGTGVIVEGGSYYRAEKHTNSNAGDGIKVAYNSTFEQGSFNQIQSNGGHGLILGGSSYARVPTPGNISGNSGDNFNYRNASAMALNTLAADGSYIDTATF